MADACAWRLHVAKSPEGMTAVIDIAVLMLNGVQYVGESLRPQPIQHCRRHKNVMSSKIVGCATWDVIYALRDAHRWQKAAITCILGEHSGAWQKIYMMGPVATAITRQA